MSTFYDPATNIHPTCEHKFLFFWKFVPSKNIKIMENTNKSFPLTQKEEIYSEIFIIMANQLDFK